ncbi:hypothetical protein C8R44DRAFT_950930 [Mycena epipterygia]|nr:hypothetical protein C8R44DRAFT_950930 [Mycena epipterygia]
MSKEVQDRRIRSVRVLISTILLSGCERLHTFNAQYTRIRKMRGRARPPIPCLTVNKSATVPHSNEQAHLVVRSQVLLRTKSSPSATLCTEFTYTQRRAGAIVHQKHLLIVELLDTGFPTRVYKTLAGFHFVKTNLHRSATHLRPARSVDISRLEGPITQRIFKKEPQAAGSANSAREVKNGHKRLKLRRSADGNDGHRRQDTAQRGTGGCDLHDSTLSRVIPVCGVYASLSLQHEMSEIAALVKIIYASKSSEILVRSLISSEYTFADSPLSISTFEVKSGLTCTRVTYDSGTQLLTVTWTTDVHEGFKWAIVTERNKAYVFETNTRIQFRRGEYNGMNPTPNPSGLPPPRSTPATLADFEAAATLHLGPIRYWITSGRLRLQTLSSLSMSSARVLYRESSPATMKSWVTFHVSSIASLLNSVIILYSQSITPDANAPLPCYNHFEITDALCMLARVVIGKGPFDAIYTANHPFNIDWDDFSADVHRRLVSDAYTRGTTIENFKAGTTLARLLEDYHSELEDSDSDSDSKPSSGKKVKVEKSTVITAIKSHPTGPDLASSLESTLPNALVYTALMGTDPMLATLAKAVITMRRATSQASRIAVNPDRPVNQTVFEWKYAIDSLCCFLNLGQI